MRLLYVFSIFWCLWCASGVAAAESWKVEELPLLKVDQGMIESSLAVSADFRKSIYVSDKNGKFALVVNANTGNFHDTIDWVTLSKNGEHLAYVVHKSGNAGSSVVYDGVEQKQYQDVTYLSLSDDGKFLGYLATQNERQIAVLNGKELATFDEIEWLQVAPDGSQLVFIRSERNQRFLHVGSKTFGPYSAIEGIHLLPDGRVGYFAAKGERWRFRLGELESPEYAQIDSASLTISEDSKAVTFIVTEGQGMSTVLLPLDGGPIGQSEFFEDIAAPSLTVHDVDGAMQLSFAARRGKKWLTSISGKEGSLYDEVVSPGPIAAPSGRKSAYFARLDQDWRVVIDGTEYPIKGYIEEAILFDRAGESAVFVILKDGKQTVMRNDKVLGQSPAIMDGSLTLSPDGKQIAWWAVHGKEHYLQIGDTIVVGPVRALENSRLVFESEGILRTFALRDWDLLGFRVHPVKLKP